MSTSFKIWKVALRYRLFYNFKNPYNVFLHFFKLDSWIFSDSGPDSRFFSDSGTDSRFFSDSREGVATKKIKGNNHKNHKRSESSRKNQPVGEKNQNQNQLGISKENLPLVIIYIAPRDSQSSTRYAILYIIDFDINTNSGKYYSKNDFDN